MKKKIYYFTLIISLVLIGIHQVQAVTCVSGGPITTAPKMIAVAGNNIVVPITAVSINDINAISLKIEFNGTVLNYISAAMGPGFPTTGGNLIAGVDPITGRLGISYFYIDPTNNTPVPTGINLPDGSVVINLTFHYNGGTSLLNFYNNSDGTSLEYEQASTQLPYCDSPTANYYINGWVTDLAVTLTPSATDCYGASTGSITATATLGTPPYTYLWNTTPPQTGNIATGLSSGTYTVTVTDSRGAWVTASQSITTYPVVSVTTINDGPACIGTILTITPTASGGTAPYVNYAWTDPMGNLYYGDPLYVLADPAIHNGTWYVTVTDSHGCKGIGTTNVTITLRHSVSGNLKYINAAFTPMNNVTMTLLDKQNLIPASFAVTNLNGVYTFANVCNGTYFLSVSNNNKPVGGINESDAADVTAYLLTPWDIERVKFFAGDVAGFTDFLNSTDAYRIHLYFMYGTPFDRAPWSYWTTGSIIHSNFDPPRPLDKDIVVTVNNADVSNVNLYGTCTGDFNASFTPNDLKDESINVRAEDGKKIMAAPGQELDVPITFIHPAQIGVISLILNFPADLASIQNVSIIGSDVQPDWAVNGNELRIGWYADSPVLIGSPATLLNIGVKTSALFTNNQTIRFTLAPTSLNEIGDEHYKCIQDAAISLGEIITAPVGTPDLLSNTLLFENHPNPFTGSTIINYSLPADGKVTIEIHNTLGVLLTTLVNENSAKGSHAIRFTPENLAPGLYLATLYLKTKDNVTSRTIYVVYNK